MAIILKPETRAQLVDFIAAGVRSVSGAVLNAGKVKFFEAKSHVVKDATNTGPIEIETVAQHGLTTGARVYVFGVGGNGGANNTLATPTWTIVVTTDKKFTLTGSSGTGPYQLTTGTVYVTKPVYQDQAKAQMYGGLGGNEVTLDGNGRNLAVWADGVYKVRVENSTWGSEEYTIPQAAYGFSVVDARRDFGVISATEDLAYGDGNYENITRNRKNLQAAIDYCIGHGNCKLYLPGGDYYIDEPLMILKFKPSPNETQYDYVTLQIEGESRAFTDQPATRIYTSYYKPSPPAPAGKHKPDRPAIIIQAGRAVVLKGLNIRCQNGFPMVTDNDYMNAANDDTQYVVNNCRNDRFSPHGAIVIDPFIDTRPKAPLPNVDNIAVSVAGTPGRINTVNPHHLVTGATVTISGNAPFNGTRTVTVPFGDIIDASNFTPIKITTSQTHNLAVGDIVYVTGVTGNYAANGTWTVANPSEAAKTFELAGSVGNHNYVAPQPGESGGKVYASQTFTVNGTFASGAPGGQFTPATIDMVPDANYGYPTLTSYYTDGGPTGSVTIEECKLDNGVTGLCVGPTGETANGEDIFVKDTSFERNRVHVATCHSQQRNVVLENLSSSYSLFIVSTRQYGMPGGVNAAPYIHKAAIGHTKYLFDVGVRNQPFNVVSMHAEIFLGIGFIGEGKTGDQTCAVFTACNFQFHARLDGPNSVPPYEPFVQIDQGFRNYAAVEFVSCNFSNDAATPAPPYRNVQPLVFFNNAPIHFRSCGFGFPTVGPESNAADYNIPEQGGALNSTIPIAFHDPSVVTFDSSIVLDRSLGSGWDGPFAYLDHTAKGGSPNAVRPRTPLPSTSYLDERVGATGQIRSLGTSLQKFSLGTNLSLTDAGHDKVSFTVDPSHEGLVVVGDLVYFDSGTSFNPEGYRPVIGGGSQNLSPYPSTALAGMVSAVVNNTITLKYRPISLVMPGSYGLAVKYFARHRPPLRGEITFGSNIIQNIRDGITGLLVDPRGSSTVHAYWKKWERIIHPAIPPGAYITAIDGTSITLSKNATSTDSLAPLMDATAAPRLSDGRTAFYKLVWEIQGTYYKTRHYETLHGMAIVHNAQWNGSDWLRDTVSWNASKLTFDSFGRGTLSSYTLAAASFNDSAWNASLQLPSLTAGTAITMDGGGEIISDSQTVCSVGAEATASSADLGTSITYRKKFSASPSVFTYVVVAPDGITQNISGSPLTWFNREYGAGVYCHTSATHAYYYGKAIISL